MVLTALLSVKEDKLRKLRKRALQLYNDGYVQPLERDDILALGNTALGTFKVGVESFKNGWIHFGARCQDR